MVRLERGSTVGDYRIEDHVRSGPAATVFRASQAAVDRQAMLYVANGPAGSAEAERFLDRARHAATLNLPRLVRVYDVGTIGDVSYAATAAPRGRLLSEILESGQLPPAHAVAVAEQLAEALEPLGDRAPAALDAHTVFVDGSPDAPEVQLSALDAVAEAPGDPTLALARLMATMTRGEELTDVLRRADEGAFATPTALAAAARTALAPRPRATRRLVAVGASLAALAAAAAVLVTVPDDDDDAAEAERAPATARAATITATVALGASPASVAFGEGAVWAATQDRRVMRVDLETNRVTGAPVRFSSGRGPSNITVRAGGGAVYALDGDRGVIARLDPDRLRVTRRARFDLVLQGLAVSGNTLWLTTTTPPSVTPRRDELIRLDGRTLRQAGPATRVGLDPFDVDLDVAAGAAFVSNANNGTVHRVDLRTGAAKEVLVAGLAGNSALAAGRLWVPSPVDGTVTSLAIDDLELAGQVIRFRGSAFAAVTLGDVLWVLVSRTLDPASPTALHRIEPGDGRIAGRPLPLGGDVGWPAAGAGSLWVPAPGRRELLRVTPADVPPAPGRVAPPPETREVRSGPLTPGRWEGSTAGVGYSFEVSDDGWIAAATSDEFEGFELRRFSEPEVGIGFTVPKQIITASGGVTPVQGPQALIDAFTRHPLLDTSGVRDVELSNASGSQVEIRVKPHRGYPPFCGGPCVPLYARGKVTVGAEAPQIMRVTALRTGGTLAINEESPPDRSGFPLTSPVVESLRFR